MMIVVSPQGGHGTSHLGGFLANKPGRLSLRPDAIFKRPILRNSRPLKKDKRKWNERTHVKLNLDKSILDNLYSLTKNPNVKNIILWGACSEHYEFLTRYGVKAYCLVRHPVSAYVSLYRHKHPELAKPFGGFEKKRAIENWARIWNSVVTDFLKSGNKIIRFEFFSEDVEGTGLEFLSDGWKSERRNDEELNPDLTKYLKILVMNNYQKLYGEM